MSDQSWDAAGGDPQPQGGAWPTDPPPPFAPGGPGSRPYPPAPPTGAPPPPATSGPAGPGPHAPAAAASSAAPQRREVVHAASAGPQDGAMGELRFAAAIAIVVVVCLLGALLIAVL
jgi:hypothetical protein